ncbi:MAG: tryptophan--tRNA ligase [Actinomycetota bacterium]|nr:tryptophan--tRNA ligase [Actinomycetota bacterium]
MTRVFSGIQPTGQKHIGNYLGAIRHYVADQERYGAEAIFCVVDLHSMTQPFDPAELTTSTRDTFATLVASGLDPERAIVFVQSHVHEHAELAWLFNCVATFGELNRMVAFKEKSAGRESVSAGLFTYPVLQAADILLYLADRVPVGEDQRQHLELARDIAHRFNTRYGKLFPPPQAAIPPTAARISDLQEPERKMSTSSLSSEDGRLLMLDEPDVIRRKFKRAVTDSEGTIRHDWETKPGVSNLLEILQGVSGEAIPALEARYAGQGYGHLKNDVAEAVIEHLAPIRERHAALMTDTAELDRLMALGASRARAIATPVLAQARARMGLLPGVPT